MAIFVFGFGGLWIAVKRMITNQMTQMFGLDYKTVRHHDEVLRKHHVITIPDWESFHIELTNSQMNTKSQMN